MIAARTSGASNPEINRYKIIPNITKTIAFLLERTNVNTPIRKETTKVTFVPEATTTWATPTIFCLVIKFGQKVPLWHQLQFRLKVPPLVPVKLFDKKKLWNFEHLKEKFYLSPTLN